MDNATDPNVGAGPYGVDHDEADGFYWLTKAGERTGKSYPIGKTAYRAARKLNDAKEYMGAVTGSPPEGFLEEEPAPRATSKQMTSKAKLPKPAKAKPAARSVAKTKRDLEKRGILDKPAPTPVPDAPTVEALGDLEPFKGSREEWLNAFTAKARPIFKAKGFELPEKIRVSVGFMFRSPKAIGQCWAESASSDGHREVFINPTQADSARVADILTHELCHTLFGPKEKHGKEFKRAAYGMGLEGKATATVAGDAWRAWAFPILRKLGSLPHGALDPSASGVKKQTTRLLKCECDACGFIFRATAKHVNEKRLRCPDWECEGVVKVDGAEEGGEE